MWIGGARAIVLNDEKKVLMVRQRHEGRDIWMVPGGAIEAGENAEQAAVRETKEETGLDIGITRLLWHVEEVSGQRGQRFVNFFLAEVIGGAPCLGADPERDESGQVLRELRFMTREEIEDVGELYPEYLKEELWNFLSGDIDGYNPFRIRITHW